MDNYDYIHLSNGNAAIIFVQQAMLPSYIIIWKFIWIFSLLRELRDLCACVTCPELHWWYCCNVGATFVTEWGWSPTVGQQEHWKSCGCGPAAAHGYLKSSWRSEQIKTSNPFYRTRSPASLWAHDTVTSSILPFECSPQAARHLLRQNEISLTDHQTHSFERPYRCLDEIK